MVRQLGVELVYVEYLGELDTRAVTKRTNLGEVLDLLPGDVAVPEGLTEILDGGMASYGPGKQYRDARPLPIEACAASEGRGAPRGSRCA